MPKRRRRADSGTQSDLRKPSSWGTDTRVLSAHEDQFGPAASTREPHHRTSKPSLCPRCSQQSNDTKTLPSPVLQRTKAFNRRPQPDQEWEMSTTSALPPRREMTPTGAVVASFDQSQAGFPSTLSNTSHPYHQVWLNCRGHAIAAAVPRRYDQTVMEERPLARSRALRLTPSSYTVEEDRLQTTHSLHRSDPPTPQAGAGPATSWQPAKPC